MNTCVEDKNILKKMQTHERSKVILVPAPSLLSLMVSVDVKHSVYLLVSDFCNFLKKTKKKKKKKKKRTEKERKKRYIIR